MPPKKRRAPVPKKTGKRRQYLNENFDPLPNDPKELKIGHIVLQYYKKEKSPATTNRCIMDMYSCSCIKNQLGIMLNRHSKMSDSTSETVMKRFKTFCQETFHLPAETHTQVHPEPSSEIQSFEDQDLDVPGPSNGKYLKKK